MDKKYVVRTGTTISQPMSREEAIKTARKYDHKGISSYIVSEEEGEGLKNGEFNAPTWS